MIKIITNYLLFFMVIIVLVGCGSGGDDDGDKYNPKSITVSKQDFDISGTSLTESQLIMKLDGHRDLLTNNIVKGVFNSSLFNFIDSAIFFGGVGCGLQNDPQFSKDNNAEFSLSLSVDHLACLGNVPIPNGTINAMLEMLSIEQAIFSQNNNPVDVSGKTWDDISFLNYNIGKINSKYAYTYSASNQEVSATLTGKYAIYAADDFNQACIFQGTLITNCIIQYLDNISSNVLSGIYVVTFEYNSIVPAATASDGITTVYFDGGSVQFRVNNWTGTLLYSASDKPPTYTATDGVQNITGTLVIN